MRKVYLNITVRLIAELEEGQEVSDMIQEMDYNFSYYPNGKIEEGIGKQLYELPNSIIDTEILDYEIIDSK